MAAAGHSHVCHHRPTPTLGESASSVRFWIPCRLFLCYKKCSPSPMEPTNGERYQLPFRLAHCYWPCSPSQWKHIKVHLSAYNHKVHYIFYWAEYMFGAMGHSRQVNPFTFFFLTYSIPYTMIQLLQCKQQIHTIHFNYNNVLISQFLHVLGPPWPINRECAVA